MDDEDELRDQNWMVLVNEEEQYSLWLADNAIPAGWSAVGPKGAKSLCLEYVEAHWTDMRPRSLRDG